MLADVAAALAKNPAVKIDLSGYADRTGNTVRNVELAKQRAIAVRDALKAAGVAEDRINLKKPEFAVGGTSDESRRVDVIVSG
jgi:outer membrane protein OmpA-like peptidoglycan-associated protein